jgi:hypothetical protein
MEKKRVRVRADKPEGKVKKEKKVVVEEVEETAVIIEQPIKSLFRKIGGGSFLFENHHIKSNQTFWADPDDIPKSFRNVVILVDPGDAVAPKAPNKLPVPPEVYHLEEVEGDLWNVVNEKGKPINEAPLSKASAEELLTVLGD